MPRKINTPEAPDTDAQSNGESTPTPEDTPTPNAAQDGQSGDVEATEDSTKDKPKRKPTPDTSAVSLDAIKGAVIADPTAAEDPELVSEFIAAGAPTRERKPEQKAMDEVAQAAYAAWVKAGRPSQWAKMPVVTFYLTEEELPAWRHLIRRACSIADPTEPDTGVRVHFGNEFTLNERTAKRIGHEDDIGKTVLMWAAIAKRPVSDSDKRRAAVVEENKERKEQGEAPERPEE